MQSALTCSSDTQSLRLRAKQKFAITSDSEFQLRVHGELDPSYETSSWCTLMLKKFYPRFSTSTSAGIRYDFDENLKYIVHGSTKVPITSNGLLSFNVKGKCATDKQLQMVNKKGAAELSWAIINFQKDQDVRLKIGFEIFEKMPYFQIGENNLFFTADMKGRWNLNFFL